MKNLDKKDKKILFALDKNSRASLPTLSKQVRLSKEVIHHRIKNLIKRNIILRFQSVISTYRLGYQSFKLYLKLQNMTEEVRQEMKDCLLSNESVYWAALCQGRWDMIIAVWAKNVQELGLIEEDILNKFTKHIQEKDITITRRSVQYNRRWFYYDKLEPIETTFGEDSPKIELDKTDIELLRHLSSNARIKISELAKKTNIAVSTARNRLRQLEKKQAIMGYKFALNTKLLGHETCKAFLYLKNITEEKRHRLITHCRMHPNIINIVFTIGSWDMEVELETKNFDEYYRIMNEIMEKNGDIIRNYESVLISEEPKQTFMPGAYG